MNRLTLGQIRQSTLPEPLGLCAADLPRIAAYVNEATQRLLFAGGETGWYGTWAKMAFNVDSVNDPYITLPRTVARLAAIDVCNYPVAIQNEWYEFLQFGIGLQPANRCQQPCQLLQAYDRGVVITAYDLDTDTGAKTLRLYPTSSLDVGSRVLLQGKDQNGVAIWNLDGPNRVEGEYVTLASPFVDTVAQFTEVTGIQKNTTYGRVSIYQVDPDDGESSLLVTMDPGEQVAGYRRYFLNGLPRNCCNGGDTETVQVTALAKLEFIPVAVDQDYCLIGNLPALKEECQSVRYGEMDNPSAQVLATQKHKEAIRLLNQELTHYLGRLQPAVNVAPFGNARLEHSFVGTLM